MVTLYSVGDSLGHVLLDVPPALADLEEDGRVAADDDDARHQEGKHHQELLRRVPVFPEKIDGHICFKTSPQQGGPDTFNLHLTCNGMADLEFPYGNLYTVDFACTVLVLRMVHRKWKETRQLPSMLPGSAVHGCSLVSFHFLWAILCPQAVCPE